MNRTTSMLFVAAACTLVTPDVAFSRPASTTVAPAKTAKPGHGKKQQAEPPVAVVEPWTQSPRYGAPWKAAPSAPLNATAKGTSARVSGSVFEFFFWVFAVLVASVAGAAVSSRVRSARQAPWEARPAPAAPDATPKPQPEETSPTR